jgi:hypothetical protein
MKTRIPAILSMAVFAILAGCTTSDVIMTGQARSPVSLESVKMYLRPPEKFESIGLVTASSNSTPLRRKNKQSALTELRTKAAALGANGILLLEDDGSVAVVGTVTVLPGSSVGIASSGRGTLVEVKGEAIYVQAE